MTSFVAVRPQPLHRSLAGGRSPQQLGHGGGKLTSRHQGRCGSRTRQQLQPCCATPFDQAWGPALDLNSVWDTLPQNLFAISLFPYLGFLYHLTRSKQAPPLMLFGFYFLLVFVFATIPAGIYAKQVYGLALANVDWLHGSAESLLTLTNLFIVLGLRNAIRSAEETNAAAAAAGNGSEAADVAANEKQPAASQD